MDGNWDRGRVRLDRSPWDELCLSPPAVFGARLELDDLVDELDGLEDLLVDGLAEETDALAGLCLCVEEAGRSRWEGGGRSLAELGERD